MEWSLYRTIREQAAMDEAEPADAVVVFGAAQYNGTPSPVLKARLDHAFDLEERGLAPVVITTGGSGGEDRLTENVTLNFETMDGVYKKQQPDGSLGPAIPWSIGASGKC